MWLLEEYVEKVEILHLANMQEMILDLRYPNLSYDTELREE